MGKATADIAYDRGFDAGYTDGFRLAGESYAQRLEGTSIVIPTYNKAEYLRMCIDSIEAHTPEPHEIIVVDNASTDDTVRMLKRFRGKVRVRVMAENRGFAGAVNAGLMMAKGSTVLLLNNDTLVTPRWLSGLLACLHSDERIGMVGPVTNYIGGPQQIAVPYADAAGMPAFAAAYNRTDPARWTDTDRLVGFCLLFRRELLERTGYFDEGFRIGNYEDDDYCLRVRLQGKRLVMASDTFIHHFGSVSMKALGDKFLEVEERNKAFYFGKWGDPAGLSSAVREPVASETAFYPARAAVSCGGALFWLEHGVKRRLDGAPARIPVTPLNRLALRRYASGEPVAAAEAEARWLGETPGAEAAPDGTAELDGRRYAVEGGVRRPIAGTVAWEAWGLERRPKLALGEAELRALPEGLPIAAPPQTWDRL